MNRDRVFHTMMTLNDGRAFVTGGRSSLSGAENSAELFDAGTQTWRFTSSPMTVGREGHFAVALADGRVLIGGGADPSGNELTSAEVFDPVSEAFQAVASMNRPHRGPGAVVLRDGRVVVISGLASGGAVDIYNPVTNTWTPGAPLPSERNGFATVLLKDGTVLVLGGQDQDGSTGIATVSRYDPIANTWTDLAPLATARLGPSATLLSDGHILLAGGIPDPQPTAGSSFSSTEFYDPLTGSTPGPSMSFGRAGHTATLLPSGDALVVGGENSFGNFTRSYVFPGELFDHVNNVWRKAGSTNVGRSSHRASLLLTGQVLVTGGVSDPTFGNSQIAASEVWGTASTHALTVASINPSSGIAIAVNPLANNGLGNGATQFIRTYNAGLNVMLGAPSTTGGSNFSGWTGCDSAAGTTCTVTMDTDRTVVANYVPLPPTIATISPRSGTQGQTLTLTVAGANFSPTAQLSFSTGAIRVNGIPVITSSQIVAAVTISIDASPSAYDLVVTNSDGQRSTLTGAFAVTTILPPSPRGGFLAFPLRALTPNTVKVVSVFDHHVRPDAQTGAPLFYKNDLDGAVVDFGGEEGLTTIGSDNSDCCPSYSNVDTRKNGASKHFSVNGNYANPTGLAKLSYDGHAGYDFDYNGKTFRQPILAPADGVLFIPDQDPITLRASASTAPDKFDIMAIDHRNGFVTWYLHVGCLAGTTNGTKIVCTSDEDYRGLIDRSADQRVCTLDSLKKAGCPVHQGDVIGLAGNMGLSPNTSVAHLHFEVRIGLSMGPNGLPTCSLPLCRPVDPYGWDPAPNAPVQIDPYSQYLGGSNALPLWLHH